MSAGSDQKFEYARKLAAALCYVALVRLDTICIQPFERASASGLSAAADAIAFRP